MIYAMAPMQNAQTDRIMSKNIANVRLEDLPPPPAGKFGWPWTEASSLIPEKPFPGQEWPRISIVTPSYNQGAFIEETIRSVLLQNYPHLEYIVMDGGSSDSTQEILERYRPWISQVVSKPDHGQSDAIASGFQSAHGDILAWLCSDDLYLKGALVWAARKFLENPSIDLVCAETRLDQGRGWEEWMAFRYVNSTPTYAKLIACGQTARQPGCFWTKRAYLKTPGVDRSLVYCMDYDLLMKLCSVGAAQYWDHEIAWLRSHQASKSSTMPSIHSRERRMILEKALSTTDKSRLYLCALAYVNRGRNILNFPRTRWYAKAWNLGRLAGSLLYRFLRGDALRWHPIDGFGD